MVFFTKVLCMAKNYKISPSRYHKRMQMKRLAAKYSGRSWNCYTLGIRLVNKAMKYSTGALENREDSHNRLYNMRLEAACLEHNMDKKYLLSSLAEHDINLNRETLANLAIYEPRTFQSITEFVKERAEETGLQSEAMGSHLGMEVRGVTDKVKKASS